MSSPAEVSDLWIRRFGSATDVTEEPRLFCFPHAGGAASYYFPLAQALSPAAAVFGVQYPGRQDRRHEAFVDDIGEMADRVCAALVPMTDRPFAFFGHSMGAIVAFEVARRIGEWAGIAGPDWLFVSGRRAPSRYRTTAIHRRDEAGLVAEMRNVGGTRQSLLDDPESRGMIIPVIRNDYRAIESYRYVPGEPLSCPITALVGDRDPQTTLAEASAWREHTTGPFELQVFDGDHFYLDRKRPAVADLIQRTLGSVRASR